jgi:ParB-like chromosome segregation protein Spo0J
MIVHLLSLREIRVDGDTQARERLDEGVIEEYAEVMRRHVRFPPVIIYNDGADNWLADGFHRYHAARKANVSSLEVEVRVGSVEMARLYAATANAAHGLRRTLGDKRRAVQMVLATSEGRRWSQERIAKHCGVAKSWVCEVLGSVRSELPNKNPNAKLSVNARKHARIAEELAKHPAATNHAVARKLKVDPKTVRRVRANPALMAAAEQRSASTAGKGAGSHGAPPRGRSYSCETASAVAQEALAAMRAARAKVSDADWSILRGEIDHIG